MTEKVVLYLDMFSQPGRAVWWFLKLNDIPHELKLLSIMSGEHKTPEYAKIHPFQKIPAIDDQGFKVFESHTILRYLAQKYNTPSHWYPSSLEKRVLVDEYLDWHHGNLRKGVSSHVVGQTSKKYNYPVTEEFIQQAAKDFESAYQAMEDYWLNGRPYIAGEEVSIADLSAVCELNQLKFLKFDFSTKPNVFKWMQNMQKLPFYDEINQQLDKFTANA